MIKPDHIARLRLRHHVEHELGIVMDGPGLGLRFADMPKRRYESNGPRSAAPSAHSAGRTRTGGGSCE